MSKRIIVVLAVVWMVILTAVIASSLTLALTGGNTTLAAQLAGSQSIMVSDSEYQSISRFARLNQVLELIENQYYTETNEDDLILGAIRGMISTLDDPYSYYRTPEEMSQDEERQSGVYYGVGIQLTLTDNSLLITRVFKDSPAQEAGIASGDILIGVGDVDLSTADDPLNTAVNMLLGESDTTQWVTLQRGEETLHLEVARRAVTINRVESAMLDNSIGYISIYEFMGDDVTGFSSALDALKAAGAVGMIIDLRDNPGGLLSDVVDISDMVLPEGLIVSVESRSGALDYYYSDAAALDMPLAVLVNGSSASASEILSAAVQDLGAGVIVGEQTFGKGIVQSIIPFYEDGAGIHLTTACYYTPSGRSIHESGVTPDISVTLDDGDYVIPEMPDAEHDAQLRAAVEYLMGEINGEGEQHESK